MTRSTQLRLCDAIWAVEDRPLDLNHESHHRVVLLPIRPSQGFVVSIDHPKVYINDTSFRPVSKPEAGYAKTTRPMTVKALGYVPRFAMMKTLHVMATSSDCVFAAACWAATSASFWLYASSSRSCLSLQKLDMPAQRRKCVDIPSLVRLAINVAIEAGLRLKPLGAFDAVVLAKPGQVLSSLGVLPLCQMSGRQQVCLDLVNVADKSLSMRLSSTFDPCDAHRVFLRVLVIVRLLPTPMVKMNGLVQGSVAGPWVRCCCSVQFRFERSCHGFGGPEKFWR